MARGRKPKIKEPSIIEEVIEVPIVEELPIIEEEEEEEKIDLTQLEGKAPLEVLKRLMNTHRRRENEEWDVVSSDKIEYFDSELSYELTGYKPINSERGLDFNPEWFTEARRSKEATGKYCNDHVNGKAYMEFWDREYERCADGITINGYTITGDNYYFLNYYRLPNLSSAKKAGGGRGIDFPNFYVKQYEYFHYIELCKELRMNAIGLKARGVESCPPITKKRIGN